MKNHLVFSFNVLSSIPQLKDISRMVLYRYERYDGHGYPEGLK
ncbi:HD domain-containing phosphohydrolase [Desulfofundulus sp. TPOSR]|nr:HD domain-containing phosphohydrolase [Desulfofundulus sp. TPOSR]